MQDIEIRKISGETVHIYASMGFCGFGISREDLSKAFQKKGISDHEVSALKISSDEIRGFWANAFESFENLREVQLIAKKKIWLESFSFTGSNVQMVNLKAPELWFNDGSFIDGKQLQTVICDGRILDGQHGGLTELLFRNCSNLKRVVGFYRGEKMMPFVFGGCSSLEQPLDLYVKYLGAGSFMDCSSLKHIHLHNGLLSLGSDSFKNCISLEDIYIPDTVTSLGYETFCGCSKLKKIHLPVSFSEINTKTFKDCAALEKVFLPDCLASIGNMAFKGCLSLHKPWLPDQLKNIGDEAFHGCVSMGEIFLPAGITEIGEDAFADCGSLMIHCKRGTYAESYLKEHNLPFTVDD